MKVLLIVITIFSMAAVATLLAMNYQGTVFIDVGGSSIQLPLIYLIIGILVLFAVLYGLIRMIAVLRRAPGAISKKRTEGQQQKARGSLKRGFLEMTEGNWSKAERSLTGSAAKSEMPVLNYLAAARVAQELGKVERRDEMLSKASAADERASLAIGLTRAELQHNNDEYDAALSTLTELNAQHAGNSKIQKYLARTLHARGEWETLYGLLPSLLKNVGISAGQKHDFAVDTYSNMLRRKGGERDRDSFDELWKSVPKTYQKDPKVVKSYIRQLIHFGDAKLGAPFTRKYLKQNWDDDIVAMYSEFDIDGYKKGLAQSEKWLQQYPENPGLLAMAGFLNAKAELWGKARSLLEQSLAIKPAPQTYKLLGDVLTSMDDSEAANESYQAGLKLAIDEADSA